MKLNSAKSSTGEDDQLARYLALLDNPAALPEWKCAEDHRCLVYLTRAFALQELRESIAASAAPDAVRRMFGLEWRDVLEAAEIAGGDRTLLAEVAAFLKGRGFDGLRGFRGGLLRAETSSGAFYGTAYFASREAVPDTNGAFYGI